MPKLKKKIEAHQQNIKRWFDKNFVGEKHLSGWQPGLQVGQAT
jgi:hypothetical protein